MAGILDGGQEVARTRGENELFLTRGSSPPMDQAGFINGANLRVDGGVVQSVN